MGGVERFEDLIVWQRARTLTREIYQITRTGHFASDRGLASQIQRAAVSIMSNLAEGFERSNPNEFHHFIVIAKGSCAELRSQLYVALDATYITSEQFSELTLQAQEVARLLGGLRASVERQRKIPRTPN